MQQASGGEGLKSGSLAIPFDIRVMHHVFFLKWFGFLLIFFKISWFYPKLYIVYGLYSFYWAVILSD